MAGSFFEIHPDNFCLSIGAFRPLTYKVIIDLAGLIDTIFLLFSVCPCSLFLSLSSTLFLPFVVLSILLDLIFSFLGISVIISFIFSVVILEFAI